MTLIRVGGHRRARWCRAGAHDPRLSPRWVGRHDERHRPRRTASSVESPIDRARAAFAATQTRAKGVTHASRRGLWLGTTVRELVRHRPRDGWLTPDAPRSFPTNVRLRRSCRSFPPALDLQAAPPLSAYVRSVGLAVPFCAHEPCPLCLRVRMWNDKKQKATSRCCTQAGFERRRRVDVKGVPERGARASRGAREMRTRDGPRAIVRDRQRRGKERRQPTRRRRRGARRSG